MVCIANSLIVGFCLLLIAVGASYMTSCAAKAAAQTHPPAPPPPPAAADGGGAPITTRSFLLPTQNEPAGYALYSYLLFGSKPTPATRGRCIEALKEYLRLTTTKEQLKYDPPSHLNVTFLPLKAEPQTDDPAKILDDYYDFPRAQSLLAKISPPPQIDGPYFVSTAQPLSRLGHVSDHYLYQNMSSVPPSVVVLWVHEFITQASQPNFWDTRRAEEIALQLRTALATLAAGIDPAMQAAAYWQKILNWKG
jgi:hypothetical protein